MVINEGLRRKHQVNVALTLSEVNDGALATQHAAAKKGDKRMRKQKLEK